MAQSDLMDRASQAAAVAAQYCEEVDASARFPHEAIRAMRDSRLLGVMIPRDLGGEDASLADIAEVCCLLGQHCSSTAMVYAMHQIKVSSLVSHGRGSNWHRDFMARVASDQLLLGSSTTEAGTGGDLGASVCAIERDGNDFTVRKEASVISYARQSDAILITTRRAPDAPASDQVMAVLTKDQYRLEKTADWNTLGMRGSLWCGIAMNALSRAQAYIRAEARKKPGATPTGAARVGNAASMLQLMRSSLKTAIRRYESALASPDELTTMSFALDMNNLKIGASRLTVEIIQEALMVCGIHGYKNDTPYSVGRHLRDALSAPLMINNDRIAGNTSNLLLVHRLDQRLAG